MEKKLDLQKPVYELIQADPDLIKIMAELGFASITNPTLLNTAGRVMTIPKGAALRKLDLEEIKKELRKRGYQLIE